MRASAEGRIQLGVRRLPSLRRESPREAGEDEQRAFEHVHRLPERY